MRSRQSNHEALVLKRHNVGESDRILTLLTQSFGSIAVIAKGARKMKSSKRSALEPGNIIRAHLIETKGMPILTQAQILEDSSHIRTSLVKIRQLYQLLEIIDVLMVEEELESELFALILEMRSDIVNTMTTKTSLIEKLALFIEYLGYQPLTETSHTSVLDYVSALTNRPMKSWDFLTIKK